LSFTLILQKEHSNKMRIIINNNKTIFMCIYIHIHIYIYTRTCLNLQLTMLRCSRLWDGGSICLVSTKWDLWIKGYRKGLCPEYVWMTYSLRQTVPPRAQCPPRQNPYNSKGQNKGCLCKHGHYEAVIFLPCTGAMGHNTLLSPESDRLTCFWLKTTWLQCL
jgi:hypothetical protein